MEIKIILTAICLIIGCLFIMMAAIGIVRFPDFFARTHPASKGDTLGQAFILLGLMIYEGLTLISFKLLVILVLVLIANPTATFFLAKAADVSGARPEKGIKEIDLTVEEDAASSTGKKVSGGDSAS